MLSGAYWILFPLVLCISYLLILVPLPSPPFVGVQVNWPPPRSSCQQPDQVLCSELLWSCRAQESSQSRHWRAQLYHSQAASAGQVRILGNDPLRRHVKLSRILFLPPQEILSQCDYNQRKRPLHQAKDAAHPAPEAQEIKRRQKGSEQSSVKGPGWPLLALSHPLAIHLPNAVLSLQIPSLRWWPAAEGCYEYATTENG